MVFCAAGQSQGVLPFWDTRRRLCLLFGPFAFRLEVLSSTLSVLVVGDYSPLIPEGVALLHYWDDFLLVCADVGLLRAVTGCVAEELTRCGFIVSPKSTLSPVTCIFFLGKWLDLVERTIGSHPGAFLQMLAAWLRVAVRTAKHSRLTGKLVGFRHWHVRPKLAMGPLFAGTCCWMRWCVHDQVILLRVLHALATTMALSVEPRTPPMAPVCRIFDSMSSPTVGFLDFYGPVICVDAAWDLHGYRVGGPMPGRRMRSWFAVARIRN